MPQTLSHPVSTPAPVRERALEPATRDPFWSLKPFGLTFPRFVDDFFARTHGEGDTLIAPATDIIEEDDALNVSLELPGLRKEDVRVEFENGTLTISGEKKSETSKKTKSVQRLERRYGAFYRSFLLPSGVNGENAEAEFKDGILCIRIPKREEAKPRALKIK